MLSSLPSRCKNPTLIKRSSCLWIICLCLSTSLTRKGSFWKLSPFPGHQRWTELWLLHRLTIIHMLSVGGEHGVFLSVSLFHSLSLFSLLHPQISNLLHYKFTVTYVPLLLYLFLFPICLVTPPSLSPLGPWRCRIWHPGHCWTITAVHLTPYPCCK